MNRKSRFLVIGVIVAGVLAGTGVLLFRQYDQSLQKRCRLNLWNLLSIHKLYRGGHKNTWPASVSQMLREEDAIVDVFDRCPAVHGGQKPDYVYINWSQILDTTETDWRSGEYPLFYDRRMSNHKGRGINVVLTNGYVFWDSNAKWLKEFAAKHPTLEIPLPE